MLWRPESYHESGYEFTLKEEGERNSGQDTQRMQQKLKSRSCHSFYRQLLQTCYIVYHTGAAELVLNLKEFITKGRAWEGREPSGDVTLSMKVNKSSGGEKA